MRLAGQKLHAKLKWVWIKFKQHILQRRFVIVLDGQLMANLTESAAWLPFLSGIPQLSFSVGLGSSWEQYGTTAFRTTVTTVTPESSGSWTPQTLRTLLRVFAHCICSGQGAAPLAAPFHHPSCQALPPTKNRCSNPDDRYHVPLQPRATKTWAQNTANGDKQRKRCKLLGKKHRS